MPDSTFTIDIARFAAATQQDLGNMLRRISMDLMRAVVMSTPVDTGALRGSWVVAIGTEPQGKGRPDKDGTPTVMRNRRAIRPAKAGDVVFIATNLPYARVVEYGEYPNPPKRGTYIRAKGYKGLHGPGWHKFSAGGYSRKAPRGMVRINVAQVQAEMASIVAQVAAQHGNQGYDGT